MTKDVLVTLTENLFELNPIIHKKLLKFDSCNAELKLPVNQMIVLGLLYEEKSLSSSEICKKTYISKPQMTKIIDNLINENFVDRVPDKNDRRVINISITEEGKSYTNNILSILKETMSKKLSMLSHEKLESLSASMTNVISIFKSLE